MAIPGNKMIKLEPEWITRNDKKSGIQVTQLTGAAGDSHHLYFTNPGWYDGGKKLLIGSTRGRYMNLCSVDLNNGEILQHTDLQYKGDKNFLLTCLNPTKPEAYFYHENRLLALNLHTNQLRAIYEIPKGYMKTNINCTADGQNICLGIFEDFSHKFRIDLDRGYVGFRKIWQNRPHSMIVRVKTDGSGSEILFEEKYWIGHVNTSPTNPHLLTFCHEGPWSRVDQRIWGFNLKTREAWQIRPKTGKENFGHEYWLADGEYIGYHGTAASGKKIMGFVKYDNSDPFEVDFPHRTGHIHSNNRDMIVGDAGKVIRLWLWDGDKYDGPHILCQHNSSQKIQIYHPHPRFSQNGDTVVFSSDLTGKANVYLARMPPKDDLKALPYLKLSLTEQIVKLFHIPI